MAGFDEGRSTRWIRDRVPGPGGRALSRQLAPGSVHAANRDIEVWPAAGIDAHRQVQIHSYESGPNDAVTLPATGVIAKASSRRAPAT